MTGTMQNDEARAESQTLQIADRRESTRPPPTPAPSIDEPGVAVVGEVWYESRMMVGRCGKITAAAVRLFSTA